jgi:hypothetical protein
MFNGKVRIELVLQHVNIIIIEVSDELHPLVHRWKVPVINSSVEHVTQLYQPRPIERDARIIGYNGKMIVKHKIDGESSSCPPNFMSIHYEGREHGTDILVADQPDDILPNDDPVYRYERAMDGYLRFN